MASVLQSGDEFKRGVHSDLHPGVPGQESVARVYSTIKKKAAENVFDPAGEIVEEALQQNVTDGPVPTLPCFDYLTRSTNRFRQKMRPDEPVDLLNFEIDEDYLPEGKVISRHR